MKMKQRIFTLLTWDRRREGEKGEKDDDDIISEEEDEQGEEVNENTFKRRKSQTS